jgi:hypothetical protein
MSRFIKRSRDRYSTNTKKTDFVSSVAVEPLFELQPFSPFPFVQEVEDFAVVVDQNH